MAFTIRDLSANNSIVGYMLRTQSEMYKSQIQVSTGKVSPDYIGIARDTQNLINSENTRSVLERFQVNNDTFQLRLDTTDTVLNSINSTIKEYKDSLYDFKLTGGQDPQLVAEMQQETFKTLQVLESFFNSEADGRFLFSGGRVKTRPVDFGLTTLADFQAKFDGIGTEYPTTREAHLANINTSQSITGQSNWLTFEQDDGTIPAPNAVGRITSVGADFNNLAIGSSFTIADTGTGANDGTYTIVGKDPGGTWVQVKTEMLTTEALVGGAATAGVTLTVPNVGAPDTVFTGGGVGFDFTDIAFDRATGEITVDLASQPNLAAIPTGTTITVAGTASNDGTYTIETNTAGVLKIVEKKLADEGTAGTPYFTFTGAANLSFNDTNPDTITAPAGTFLDGFGNPLIAGTKLTVTGAGLNNGSTFTIASVDPTGTTATLIAGDAVLADLNTSDTLTAQQTTASLVSESYYNGDELTTTHRANKARTLDVDLNAVNPAFEKAIRAMFIVLQGKVGTEGGLDNNMQRAEDSLYLLNSALGTDPAGIPPYGVERTENLEYVQRSLIFQQLVINRTTENNIAMINYLKAAEEKIENIDPTEAVSRLLNQTQAMEASYQAFSRVRQLSLSNYLS